MPNTCPSAQILAQVECDLRAELEELSQGVHFKDLTISSSRQEEQCPPQLLNNSLTQEQRDENVGPATFVPMAGQCSNRLHSNMTSRSPTKATAQAHVGGASVYGGGGARLKHYRSVSQKWLERCKPDLAEFDSEPPPTGSVRVPDSEGEIEGGSGEEESEGEIEEDSDFEDSDGICEEDLWEEEEEEEQGVEPELLVLVLLSHYQMNWVLDIPSGVVIENVLLVSE